MLNDGPALWPLLFAPLLALTLLPRLVGAARAWALGLILAGAAGYGAWARSDAARTLPAGVEGCVLCHAEVRGVEAVHDPRALGCRTCHLGDPSSPVAARAHRGMVRVPGELDTVALTCGQASCHAALAERVRGSLMATVRGMVAVDRWAFGEQEAPDGTASAADLRDSPADRHLRQLCTSCHLGQAKEGPGPVTESSRGGGCAACHVQYPEGRGDVRGDPRGFAHPVLTSAVRDEACFGCHSRSGRISLAYAGWHEAHLDDAAAARLPPGSTRKLEDGRIVQRATPDVHHEKGMACVDCHLGAELMGDGGAAKHEEEAVHIRCATCHRAAPPRTAAVAELDAATRALVARRLGSAAPARSLLEDVTGAPLTNAAPLPDGTVELHGKLDGRRHLARPPSSACSDIEGHRRLSCQACHAAWTTLCATCHTRWDGAAEVVEVATGRARRGGFVEHDAPPRIGPPPLGVLRRGGEARIEPVAPGMIMTLEAPAREGPKGPSPADQPRLLRAFALAVPHTTTRAGRSCASCHGDPSALGAGAGTVTAGPSAGEWRFDPAQGPLRDGLPADAWIRFLTEGGDAVATRTTLRPLEREAQLRVLEVGRCLGCHDPAQRRDLYRAYRDSLARMPASCRRR